MQLLLNRLWGFTYCHSGATWRSGYAAACKAVYLGSIPGVASNIFQTLDQKHAGCGHCPAGQSYLDGDSDIL